jgi:hypothetical protein
MKIPLPTERAMGLVTVLSGLAIPIAMVIGAGDDLGGEGISVQIFSVLMCVVNPFGMWAYETLGGVGAGDHLLKLIGCYIAGTGLSALLWGMIDGFFQSRKKADSDAG